MHPPSPNRRMARVIMLHNNAILVNRRHNNRGKYYTLPGGGIESGESPEQAAVREVFEEASIGATITRLVYEDDSPQFGHTYYYLASYVSGEPAVHPEAVEAEHNRLGDDTYEPLWLPVWELAKVNLLPEALKLELLLDIGRGFPEKPVTLTL